jgi:hypothetical protein
MYPFAQRLLLSYHRPMARSRTFLFGIELIVRAHLR